MKIVTAQRAMKEVQTTAEKIHNDETAEVGTVSLGDVVRQGDLYLVAIERPPDKRKLIINRQLAPGTTQGSRHVLLGGCPIFDGDKQQIMDLINIAVGHDVGLATELIGPVFETAMPVEVDHPEHGNRILPAGVYAVVYQRAFADEVRRQLD